MHPACGMQPPANGITMTELPPRAGTAPSDHIPQAADQVLAASIAFLRRPESYPEPTKQVHTIETHMSLVFLTDGYAYKLKKPVRYPPLDFTTLDRREFYCR